MVHQSRHISYLWPSIHYPVWTDCPDHSSRPDWSSDQPVGRCGPAERPGDLLRDLAVQPDVHRALRCQTGTCEQHTQCLFLRPDTVQTSHTHLSVTGLDLLQTHGPGELLPAQDGQV